MRNFVAEKQLFSLFFVALAANLQLSKINKMTSRPLRTRPLLDIDVSGLIQHTIYAHGTTDQRPVATKIRTDHS